MSGANECRALSTYFANMMDTVELTYLDCLTDSYTSGADGDQRNGTSNPGTMLEWKEEQVRGQQSPSLYTLSEQVAGGTEN